MRKSGRIVIYLSAFAIMAMGLLLGGPQEGLGQEEVEVVNEADSPVPVIGDVYVANPPEDPVPVQDVTKRQPFQFTVDLDLPEGVSEPSYDIGLTLGKRLTIRYVSAFVSLPRGERATLIVYAPLERRGVSSFFFPLTLTGLPSVSVEQHAVSQETLIFAEETVSLTVFRNLIGEVGAGTATATISGYLVDIP